MEKYSELEVVLIKCALLRLEELHPNIDYTCEEILVPIWPELINFEPQNIGKVFSKLVGKRALPMIFVRVCESRRTNLYRSP